MNETKSIQRMSPCTDQCKIAGRHKYDLDKMIIRLPFKCFDVAQRRAVIEFIQVQNGIFRVFVNKMGYDM